MSSSSSYIAASQGGGLKKDARRVTLRMTCARARVRTRAVVNYQVNFGPGSSGDVVNNFRCVALRVYSAIYFRPKNGEDSAEIFS